MKLKFLSLFILLFLFRSRVSSSQEINQNVNFDSIYKKINLLRKEKENKKALLLSKKLLLIGKENKNDFQIAKSFFKLGVFFNRTNTKDSSYYYYNKAKNIYLTLNDSIQVGRSLLNIAIIESDFGSFSLSDSTAVETIKYINGERNRTTASAYNCLAINSKKRHLYNDAISYYKEALEITDSKSSQQIYKNNLANVYREQKDYSKSILVLEDLLKDSITNQKTKARIIDNLTYVRWLKKPKENILVDFLFAEFIRKKDNDYYGLIASYSHLSDYFYQINKSKSLSYAKKMYEIAKKIKATNGLLEAIDKIIKLENNKNPIKYYKESIRLRDSLQKVNTQKQYKFAKIKYDYEEEEKKKLKFKTLAAQNKLIAEKENSQKKNILLIGVIFTSGLLFLLYRRKQQQRKKVLEEKYLTETSIAKKLHDDLGNNIFNVITKVQNSDYKKDEIVNDLDKLYLQTRAISHENDVIETGKEFENYFNQLIASYHSKDCKIILKDLSVLELNSLKREQQRVLYRVFNELLVNMKKHSKANLIVISCKKENKVLKINYADNGVGFKNNEVILKNGLKNMETRIKSIKGTLNFESNKGCKIKIRFKK